MHTIWGLFKQRDITTSDNKNNLNNLKWISQEFIGSPTANTPNVQFKR